MVDSSIESSSTERHSFSELLPSDKDVISRLYANGVSSFLEDTQLSDIQSRITGTPIPKIDQEEINRAEEILRARTSRYDSEVTLFDRFIPTAEDKTRLHLGYAASIINVKAKMGLSSEDIARDIEGDLSLRLNPTISPLLMKVLGGKESIASIVNSYLTGQADFETGQLIQLIDQSILISAIIDNTYQKYSQNRKEEILEYLGEEKVVQMLERMKRQQDITEIVRERTGNFTPVSPNARYSFQLIAYNEMPSGKEGENLRGNLADYLMSLFTSLESQELTQDEQENKKTQLTVVNPEEVDVIININNRVENGYGAHVPTLGNKRSMILLDSLRHFAADIEDLHKSDIDDETFNGEYNRMLKETLNGLDWIDGNEGYYRRLFQKGESLIRLGLGINYVDCTDGFYLEKIDDAFAYVPSQGNRRRLSQEVGLSRLDEARAQNPRLQSSQQWIITHDMDSKILPTFFRDLKEITSMCVPGESCILTVPIRHVADVNNTSDAAKEGIDFVRLWYGFSELRDQCSTAYYDAKGSTHLRLGVGTIHKYIFNRELCGDNIRWNIATDSGEDTEFIGRLKHTKRIDRTLTLPRQGVAIADRMREESWQGNIEHRTRAQQNVKVWEFLRMNGFTETSPDNEESPSPITPEIFLNQFYDELKTRAQTPQEWKIIQDMQDNRAKYPYTIKAYDQKPYIGVLENILFAGREIMQHPGDRRYANLRRVYAKWGETFDARQRAESRNSDKNT